MGFFKKWLINVFFVFSKYWRCGCWIQFWNKVYVEESLWCHLVSLWLSNFELALSYYLWFGNCLYSILLMSLALAWYVLFRSITVGWRQISVQTFGRTSFRGLKLNAESLKVYRFREHTAFDKEASDDWLSRQRGPKLNSLREGHIILTDPLFL